MLLGCIFVLFLFLVLILGVPGSPHVRDCIQQDSVVPAVEPCKARSQPSPLHMGSGGAFISLEAHMWTDDMGLGISAPVASVSLGLHAGCMKRLSGPELS